MLDEFALIPDIFDPAAYSKPDYADMCLPQIKDAVVREALVRDLCDGSWSRCCTANTSGYHRLAKEILRKLAAANRLCRFPRRNNLEPMCADDWCREALSTCGVAPLTGIIASHLTKGHFPDAAVASIEKLTGAPWWQARSSSYTIDRKTPEFLKLLCRVLPQANSLMFIDPNLNPSKPNYREFHKLLAPLKGRKPAPQIELHRSFCDGDGAGRTLLDEGGGRQMFSQLDTELASLGLRAEVFLWQDFHDRYLITDILGAMVGAGFDVTNALGDQTTWARLGRPDRDSIQLRYDPSCRPEELKARFTIGAVPRAL